MEVKEVSGVVNGLALGQSGRVMVAGVGQEHRMGRWTRHSDARNGLLVVRLPITSTK